MLRVLRAVPTADLAYPLRRLREDSCAGTVTGEAIEHLRTLFGAPNALGSGFAARAFEEIESDDTVRASCAALAQDLLTRLTRA